MTVLYGKKGMPNQIIDFSLKVRIMIDHRHHRHVSAHYQPASNVIQFPSKNKVKSTHSALYLEVCQQLLRPIRDFFFEEDEGGGGSLSVYDLDAYLSDLNAICERYKDPIDAAPSLDAQEQHLLQVDQLHLQVAGFEYTAENYPEIIAAYGQQLLERYFPFEGGQVAAEMKKAYADVNAMIEQAKKALSATMLPKLTR